MTRRIAHIISAGPTEGRTVPESAVSPGFETAVVESLAAPFPSDPVNLLLTEVSTVEAAMRAQQSGYDGVLIGALADYGLAAARAAVEIPVVGCGQASMLTAAGLGDRFSIVTIWPQTQAFLYDQLVRDNDVGRQCASIRYVSTAAEQATLADDDNFYTQMRAGREHMIERILGEIEAAVQHDRLGTDRHRLPVPGDAGVAGPHPREGPEPAGRVRPGRADGRDREGRPRHPRHRERRV